MFDPVETLAPRGGPGALSDLVLLCDHARNAVPPDVTPLGLPEAEMARHIAWDVGARGVTLGLAKALGAGAVLSTFSRLVIDPNRGEDDPTLVMRLYDGTVIPGNARVTQAEIERRILAYHRPYHAAIDAAIDRVLASGGAPVLVSVHSFTPQFRGRPWRPWHVGLLWDRDDRLLRPLLARLRGEPDLVVGDNEPYTGHLAGDCLWQHGTNRGLPHVLIEIRNDLIETGAGQTDWAARLAPILRAAIGDMRASMGGAKGIGIGAAGAQDRAGTRSGPGIAKEDQSMTETESDPQTEALEAAVYRRLRDHLRARPDVQNIDMMNLAGFCRNCLSRWYQEAAAEQGIAMEQPAAREIVYGMPYEDWRAQHQKEASEAQKVAFAVSHAASHQTREQDDG